MTDKENPAILHFIDGAEKELGMYGISNRIHYFAKIRVNTHGIEAPELSLSGAAHDNNTPVKGTLYIPWRQIKYVFAIDEPDKDRKIGFVPAEVIQEVIKSAPPQA